MCRYRVDKCKIRLIKLYNKLVWRILCFAYSEAKRNRQAKLLNCIYPYAYSFEAVFLHADRKFLLTLPIIYMV